MTDVLDTIQNDIVISQGLTLMLTFCILQYNSCDYDTVIKIKFTEMGVQISYHSMCRNLFLCLSTLHTGHAVTFFPYSECWHWMEVGGQLQLCYQGNMKVGRPWCILNVAVEKENSNAHQSPLTTSCLT
jgi:hypothetical protein